MEELTELIAEIRKANNDKEVQQVKVGKLEYGKMPDYREKSVNHVKIFIENLSIQFVDDE